MKGINLIKSFFPHHLKRQVRELFISTTLVNLALAMVMIFEPIYLYQIGYSLQKIMLFYLIAYAIYIFIVPLGGKFAKLRGYETGILFGTILYILFYVLLFLIAKESNLFYIAPIVSALQKSFYWPAYHADFAKFSDNNEEGREISFITIATSLVYIVGPALAGFIILQWGYGVLFTVVSVIFLGSNIPTMLTKEKFTPHDFSYRESYKIMFSKKNRKAFLAYLGFGEELVLFVVWPVFISLIITNVFDLGLIMALATFVTTMITLYIGKISDFKNKRSILKLGSAFYSLIWVARIFVTNTLGIFLADSMSRLGKNTIAVPLTAITYEGAKQSGLDKKQNVMKMVLFFEMSLVVGKLLAIVAIYLTLFFVGNEMLAFKAIFLLASTMSLLYILL